MRPLAHASPAPAVFGAAAAAILSAATLVAAASQNAPGPGTAVGPGSTGHRERERRADPTAQFVTFPFSGALYLGTQDEGGCGTQITQLLDTLTACVGIGLDYDCEVAGCVTVRSSRLAACATRRCVDCREGAARMLRMRASPPEGGEGYLRRHTARNLKRSPRTRPACH